MALKNDGDIVRGLGFVALHSGYLEEQVENLLRLLDPIEPFTEQVQRSRIGDKIRSAKAVLAKIDFETRDETIACLDTCKKAFEWRNEIIHGRIYAGFDREDTLKSGRPNVPDRAVDAQELYDLANHLADLRAGVYRPMIIKIPRALAEKL